MKDARKLGSYDSQVVSVVNMGAYLFVATQKEVWYYTNPDYVQPYVFIPLYVRLWRWAKKLIASK
jgi:hypothetical protein